MGGSNSRRPTKPTEQFPVYIIGLFGSHERIAPLIAYNASRPLEIEEMSNEFEQKLRAIADRAKLAKEKAIPAEHADRLREAEKIRTIIANEWEARIRSLINHAVKTANRIGLHLSNRG
jgi:hypothetical protein